MRISDWSSDVCSSDLRGAGVQDLRSEACAGGLTPRRRGAGGEDMLGAMQDFELRVPRLLDHAAREHAHREIVTRWADGRESRTDWAGVRSEEHTSGLQSLMRISYAVFCLKKKKKTIILQDKKTEVTQQIYKMQQDKSQRQKNNETKTKLRYELT